MNSLISTVLKEKTDRIHVQLFRYAIVGGFAYVVDFGLLFGLTETAGIPYLLSAAISFLTGLATNYALSIFWVFKTRSMENRMAEFSIFAFIGLAGLGFNELFLWAFTSLMGWHYLLSKLAATPLIFLWNFSARRFALFSSPKDIVLTSTEGE
ncbi:MAG: GtrA family protein [Acidobacteria bacterium CG_4_9_14_3_um_filter_49_7]|nr:MAG: GtrA family protein [Acidobacteria bacterium CG_4_9_14_3_um_filter_49_7]